MLFAFWRWLQTRFPSNSLGSALRKMAYDRGDSVRSTVTFTVSAANTDPSTITFLYKKPSGLITSLVYPTDAAVVKSATGIYYCDVSLDSAGTWYTRWEGTGACVATDEATLTVDQGQFA